MDDSIDRSVTPTLREETTNTQQRLLRLIEELSAASTLTDDDRDQLSFEVGILCAELRTCIDPAERYDENTTK